MPCKFRTAKQLVSHNIHSSTYNYKYTFSVEIVPVCKVCVLPISAAPAFALLAVSTLADVAPELSALKLLMDFRW